MTAYEYILRLRDQASSTLRDVARSAGIADNKIDQVDAGLKRANTTTSTWSKSLNTLKRVAVTAFAGIGISLFTSQVIDARQEY